MQPGGTSIVLRHRDWLPAVFAARSLPQRFPGMVADRLRRLGIPLELIGTVPYHLPVSHWDAATPRETEDLLAKTPCRVAGPFKDVIFPDKTAPKLLAERWASGKRAPVLMLVPNPRRQ
ncbi:MAG: hypothetical protein HYY48_09555 [Gammaproteobacteria bacterium]|nr:hypothetical protein [Gammaproteobacteria bacterium]